MPIHKATIRKKLLFKANMLSESRRQKSMTPVAADASTQMSTPELPQPQEGREYCAKLVC